MEEKLEKSSNNSKKDLTEERQDEPIDNSDFGNNSKIIS